MSSRHFTSHLQWIVNLNKYIFVYIIVCNMSHHLKNVQLISNNPLSNNVNRYGKAPNGMVEEVLGTGQCWMQNVGHLCVT